MIEVVHIWQDEEPDYGSRRMPARRRFEDELEAEALAERRIINAKKVSNLAHYFTVLIFNQTYNICTYLYALHIFSQI